MSFFSWSLFNRTKNFCGVGKIMALRFAILPTSHFYQVTKTLGGGGGCLPQTWRPWSFRELRLYITEWQLVWIIFESVVIYSFCCRCHLRHPASKISYHSLALYLCAEVGSSRWKWYWFMHFFRSIFEYQNHSCWSRRCAKNWLNKVAFPFHLFGAIYLDYANCIALTAISHRQHIVH